MFRLIDRLASAWLNFRYPLPEGYPVELDVDYDDD